MSVRLILPGDLWIKESMDDSSDLSVDAYTTFKIRFQIKNNATYNNKKKIHGYIRLSTQYKFSSHTIFQTDITRTGYIKSMKL